jgi:hypothetical protein
MKSKRKRRYVLAALLAAIVAASGFAFAAQNTVAGSRAGDGNGTVSGYNVSAISWDLNDTNPQTVDDVTFTLDAAANEVKVRVRESVDGWSGWTAAGDCASGGGNTYTCNLTALNLETVEVVELEVASAS